MNSIDVKGLERSTSIPSLESGLSNDSELQDAVRNNKIVRLIKEDGTLGVGMITAVRCRSRRTNQVRLESLLVLFSHFIGDIVERSLQASSPVLGIGDARNDSRSEA